MSQSYQSSFCMHVCYLFICLSFLTFEKTFHRLQNVHMFTSHNFMPLEAINEISLQIYVRCSVLSFSLIFYLYHLLLSLSWLFFYHFTVYKQNKNFACLPYHYNEAFVTQVQSTYHNHTLQLCTHTHTCKHMNQYTHAMHHSIYLAWCWSFVVGYVYFRTCFAIRITL